MQLRRRMRSATGHHERGEVLIEFAFASVVFFATLFAILEFGQAIWRFNYVSNLAQEGARYAAVRGQNSGSAIDTATLSTYVQSRSLGIPVTVTTPLGAPNSIRAGNVVEVRVVHNLVLGGGVLPAWNFPIQSTGRMIVTR